MNGYSAEAQSLFDDVMLTSAILGISAATGFTQSATLSSSTSDTDALPSLIHQSHFHEQYVVPVPSDTSERMKMPDSKCVICCDNAVDTIVLP